MGKNKKARSGKYFCVMLTLQLVLAIGLLIFNILKETTLKSSGDPQTLGTQIVLSMFLGGSLSIIFLVFTIINFAVSFRFRSSGGGTIKLLSILVFVLGLLLALVLFIFSILPFAMFIMFGWIMALASHSTNTNFIEKLFNIDLGSWLAIGLSAAIVIVLTIMVVIAWKKLSTIPPTAAVSK